MLVPSILLTFSTTASFCSHGCVHNQHNANTFHSSYLQFNWLLSFPWSCSQSTQCWYLPFFLPSVQLPSFFSMVMFTIDTMPIPSSLLTFSTAAFFPSHGHVYIQHNADTFHPSYLQYNYILSFPWSYPQSIQCWYLASCRPSVQLPSFFPMVISTIDTMLIPFILPTFSTSAFFLSHGHVHIQHCTGYQ